MKTILGCVVVAADAFGARNTRPAKTAPAISVSTRVRDSVILRRCALNSFTSTLSFVRCEGQARPESGPVKEGECKSQQNVKDVQSALFCRLKSTYKQATRNSPVSMIRTITGWLWQVHTARMLGCAGSRA